MQNNALEQLIVARIMELQVGNRCVCFHCSQTTHELLQASAVQGYDLEITDISIIFFLTEVHWFSTSFVLQGELNSFMDGEDGSALSRSEFSSRINTERSKSEVFEDEKNEQDLHADQKFHAHEESVKYLPDAESSEPDEDSRYLHEVSGQDPVIDREMPPDVKQQEWEMNRERERGIEREDRERERERQRNLMLEEAFREGERAAEEDDDWADLEDKSFVEPQWKCGTYEEEEEEEEEDQDELPFPFQPATLSHPSYSAQRSSVQSTQPGESWREENIWQDEEEPEPPLPLPSNVFGMRCSDKLGARSSAQEQQDVQSSCTAEIQGAHHPVPGQSVVLKGENETPPCLCCGVGNALAGSSSCFPHV